MHRGPQIDDVAAIKTYWGASEDKCEIFVTLLCVEPASQMLCCSSAANAMDLLLHDCPLKHLLCAFGMRKYLALPDDAPTFEPNFGTIHLGSQNNDSLGPVPQIGLLSFEVNDNMLDSPGSYLPFEDRNTTFPTNSTCPKTKRPDINDSRTLLVDWYHDQDDENPRNWSPHRKIWITSVIWYVVNCTRTSFLLTSQKHVHVCCLFCFLDMCAKCNVGV